MYVCMDMFNVRIKELSYHWDNKSINRLLFLIRLLKAEFMFVLFLRSRPVNTSFSGPLYTVDVLNTLFTCLRGLLCYL